MPTMGGLVVWIFYRQGAGMRWGEMLKACATHLLHPGQKRRQPRRKRLSP